MAYLLQLDEGSVVPYLLNLRLSREGRVILAAALTRELRLYADVYRDNPDRRIAPDSDCFKVEIVFRDPVSRIIHQLRLIVSDAAAEHGILRVVYAEDAT